MTFSRMTLGEPTLKAAQPPRVDSEPDCTNPLVLGPNVLRDPGFEQHLTNVPSGGGGLTFPGEAGEPINGNQFGYWYFPPDYDLLRADWSKGGWLAWSNANYNPPGDCWYVSTANPRSGTYHARIDITNYPTNNFYFPTLEMFAIGLTNCDDDQIFSARVDPGNYISWDAHIAISQTTGTPQVIMYYLIYDESYTQLANDGSGYINLTSGAYANYSHSSFAPAGAYWMTAAIYIAFDGTASGTYAIDIDDCTLEIA